MLKRLIVIMAVIILSSPFLYYKVGWKDIVLFKKDLEAKSEARNAAEYAKEQEKEKEYTINLGDKNIVIKKDEIEKDLSLNEDSEMSQREIDEQDIMIKQAYKIALAQNVNNEFEDEKYIKKHIFGKDTNNKGYSDHAEKLINEDLKNVNNDPILKNMFIKKVIGKRILVLSKNKDEYKKNYIKSIKLEKCIVKYIVINHPKANVDNFLSPKEEFESSGMGDLMDYMDHKYTYDLNNVEKMKLMNTYPTDTECIKLR